MRNIIELDMKKNGNGINCSATNAFLCAMKLKGIFLYNHALAVGLLAEKLTRALGFNKDRVEMIKIAGFLHDIGKISVRSDVLLKPSPLNKRDWEQVMQHPEAGAKTLRKFPELEEVSYIISYHHETEDGKGYPYGLHGNSVPYESKIIRACDIFAATTMERAYKPPYSNFQAVKVVMGSVKFGDDHRDIVEQTLKHVFIVGGLHHNGY